jgi:predicted XRE-type DNA-binding protein
MLTEQDRELEFLLEPVNRKGKLRLKKKPHFLKNYFRDRGISQVRLAKLLGIHQPMLSNMLNNSDLMDCQVERKLLELKNKIDRYEEIKGKRFGT